MKFLGRVLAVLAVLALLIGGGFSAVVAYAKYESSRVELPSLEPHGSSIIYASDGKTVLGKIASAEAGKQLKDGDIPQLIRLSHMAAEDREFYVHGPISLKGIAWATIKNFFGLSFRAGGSTITQQQAKKYVGSDKTLQRKVDELPYAYRLENDYTKDQILGMYVNSNYYGRGAYGIQDAALTWFGVPATKLASKDDSLDVARAAFLAALIQKPSYFAEHAKGAQPSDLTHADELWNRVRYVLDGLHEVKGVPADQMVPAATIVKAKGLLPLKLTNTVKDSGKTAGGDSYLTNYVRDGVAAWQTEIAKKEGVDDATAAQQGKAEAERLFARGGLKIRLSIDDGLQALAVKAHRQKIGPGQSGVIVLDPGNGGVLAMSGGRDYDADPFNYAMYGSRPPGSTMKAFVLADAVSHGVSPNSVFAAPASITVDGPPIWDHTHKAAPGCKMTLADALAESNNVVYTEAITGKMANCSNSKLSKIGDYPVTPSTVEDLLRKAGADASPVPKRESPAPIKAAARLAIGDTIELSPLKLAVMAGSLATGTYHKPHVIDRIDAPNGENLFEYDDESHSVLDEKYTAIVNQVLTGVFTHGTATDDQVDKHPLAGKTGTTDTEQGDSWMFAFNAKSTKSKAARQMVCTAMKAQDSHSAGAGTGKVCQDFFEHALAGTPTVNFPAADLNAGKHVGLSEPAPVQTTAPPTTQATTPESNPTTDSSPEPKPSRPGPTTKSAPTTPPTTRSVPPTERTGGPATGNATPPGNPPPPGGQGNNAVALLATMSAAP